MHCRDPTLWSRKTERERASERETPRAAFASCFCSICVSGALLVEQTARSSNGLKQLFASLYHRSMCQDDQQQQNGELRCNKSRDQEA